MDLTERRLVDYLKKYAFGIENSVRRKQIIRDLGIPDRELREMKKRIVHEYKIPIGSTEKGYAYASNDLEVMRFRNEHNSRMMEYRESMLGYEEIVELKDQPSML